MSKINKKNGKDSQRKKRFVKLCRVRLAIILLFVRQPEIYWLLKQSVLRLENLNDKKKLTSMSTSSKYCH